VETAMQQACQESDVQVKEFTVAPKIDPEEGLPYHEWFIEFENPPQDTENLAQKLDQSMQEQNVYYEDLLKGSVLRTLVITTVADGGFQQYMKGIGKLGGQNKVPRLSNDRKIVDKLPLK
ncbi:MAG: GH3 auxin-responsive promoter family protein, partial [Bacteroidota bacterium]|nr:GH3 auxin-responsive promoter family protein [Bacteroidota bacterium]